MEKWRLTKKREFPPEVLLGLGVIGWEALGGAPWGVGAEPTEGSAGDTAGEREGPTRRSELFVSEGRLRGGRDLTGLDGSGLDGWGGVGWSGVGWGGR